MIRHLQSNNSDLTKDFLNSIESNDSLLLDFRIVDITLERGLLDFFEILKANGDERFFHPHPLNAEEAYRLATYSGNDLYFVLRLKSKIVGYGMLRGWDEGYKIPSLGIALHPEARGKGFAKLFINFLHEQAAQREAKKVRLKVHKENRSAIKLYKSVGYKFEYVEDENLVGFLEL